jgi:hypothetical protein
MSSEAEFERLYQEFVRKGGGALTGTNTPTANTDVFAALGETVNTPASYYNDSNKIGLTPSELAELNAAEEQYNKQQALSIISSEITANNFTNPYSTIASTGITEYTAYGISPGVSSLQSVDTSFNLLGSSANGGNSLTQATIIAGVLESTGVDFENILKGAGLGAAAIGMFSNLSSHTASQILDLPQTLQDADMLSGLNKSFGEADNSCSLFNDLMGVMSGAFDGAFDILGSAKSSLLGILDNSGVMGMFDSISSQVTGLINGLIGPITDNINSLIGGISGIVDSAMAAAAPLIAGVSGMINSGIAGVKSLMGDLGGMAAGALGAVKAVANQILGEIAGIANMASQIASKLAAMAMSAAMLDPCKLAVLMNTGSAELKNAAGLLTAPLAGALPDFSIPTSIDPRTTTDDVTQQMAVSLESAQKQPGVPQSPISSAAGIYSPMNAYLFDLYKDFDTSLTEKHETIIASDGSAKVVNKPVTGSNSVSATNTSITPSEQQLQGQPATPELDTPPKIEDVDGLSDGGAAKSAAEPEKTRADAKNPQTDQTASAASGSSTGFQNQFSSGIDTDGDGFGYKEEKLNPLRPQSVNSKAYKSYRAEIMKNGDISSIRRQTRTVHKEIVDYLRSPKTIWQSTSHQTQAKVIADKLRAMKGEGSQLTSFDSINRLTYMSPGADIDPVQEAEKRRLYDNTIKPQSLRVIANLQSKLNNLSSSWQSIKSQTVRGL